MGLNSRILALMAVFSAMLVPITPAWSRPLPPDYEQTLDAPRVATHPGAATIQVAPASTTADTGFSWGDASAGAGAMLAVVALGTGGLILVRRRHHGPPGARA